MWREKILQIPTYLDPEDMAGNTLQYCCWRSHSFTKRLRPPKIHLTFSRLGALESSVCVSDYAWPLGGRSLQFIMSERSRRRPKARDVATGCAFRRCSTTTYNITNIKPHDRRVHLQIISLARRPIPIHLKSIASNYEVFLNFSMVCWGRCIYSLAIIPLVLILSTWSLLAPFFMISFAFHLVQYSVLLSGASAHSTQSRIFRKKAIEKDAIFSKSSKAKSSKAMDEEFDSMGGMNTMPTYVAGVDNSFRLLKREGELIVAFRCHYVSIQLSQHWSTGT